MQVPIVDIAGLESNISIMGTESLPNKSLFILSLVFQTSNKEPFHGVGMVRMASAHEPAVGLQWLVDDGSAPPAKIGGYKALLMYRDA